MKTILIGYGNVDRQDDGVAWHILKQVANRLGMPAPATIDDEWPEAFGNLEFLFTLQLTPELAETLAQVERVCFVDAHTGRVPEEIHREQLHTEFQKSPLTHHMTPQTCLALTYSLYRKSPEATLFSVRGYEFGFSHELSSRTQALATQAAGLILEWLNEPLHTAS